MASRSLSIVYACPFFDPALQFGGPVTQLRAICRGLAERGHHVRVVTTDVGVPEGLERGRWLEKDGYEVHYARSAPWGRFPPYYNANVATPLEEALANADVLDLQSCFALVNHVAGRAATRRRVPFVVTPRNALSPLYLRQRRWQKELFLRLWERPLLRRATAIRALHEAERTHIAAQASTRDKTRIITNACELAGELQWPSGRTFRDLLGLDADVPLVLFMSRLHPLKGLELLCRAFSEVRHRVPNAVLALAGEDEGALGALEHAAAPLLADGAIRLVGPLRGQLKLSALVGADVFTLTSRAEGIPNAVLEALSAGTPCVITEACNVPAVATHDAGRVTRLEPQEIAAALVELLTDPAKRARMGKNAAAYAAAAHRPDRIAAELEALYLDCVRIGVPE